jgi:hypothetical protein
LGSHPHGKYNLRTKASLFSRPAVELGLDPCGTMGLPQNLTSKSPKAQQQQHYMTHPTASVANSTSKMEVIQYQILVTTGSPKIYCVVMRRHYGLALWSYRARNKVLIATVQHARQNSHQKDFRAPASGSNCDTFVPVPHHPSFPSPQQSHVYPLLCNTIWFSCPCNIVWKAPFLQTRVQITGKVLFTRPGTKFRESFIV